jgi:hypothetical protein
MKALARRVKGSFSAGLGVCSMIAITCSTALGQSTPDCPSTGCVVSVPEPDSYLMFVTGLGLIILIGWLRRKSPTE